MDDRDFFDHLYQLWAKTTYAKDRYWDYQPDERLFVVSAVGEGESIEIAWGMFEPDADFITAVHGCFPDLVRRLHAALDEADAADYDRDSRECRIAELELELQELKSK